MINTAILVGRVGRKEIKPIKNGGTMTVISLETIKKYTDSHGKPQKQATWHNVNCFSKLSDYVEQYVNVNDLVFVQGEIQNKKIKHVDHDSYIYSLHADQVRLVDNNWGKLSPTNYNIF